MKHIAFYSYFLLFFVPWGGMAVKATPPENVTIEIRPSLSSPTIGDSLSVFCTVTIPDGVHVSEPYPAHKSPFLDSEIQWKKEETFDSGIAREYYGFLTYVFSADTLTIGPFSVDYINPEGDTGTVSSNKFTLLVKGVVENYESIPLSNRTPVGIPSQSIPLWIIILLILITAVLIGGLVYYLRKKKTAWTPSPLEPIDEIEEFERIRSLKLHEKGRIRELYILVSNAMRGFIHRNMKFDAMYRTSEEIIANLSRDSGNGSILNLIREILDESDMVKFAKYAPSVDLSSSIIDRALIPVKEVLEKIEREKEQLAAELETSDPTETKGEPLAETTIKQSGGIS